MLRQSLKLGQTVAYRWSSTAAVLKADPVESSYVQSLQSEWKTAKPFKEIPGPTRWQMVRGFMKGGEYSKMDMQELMLYFRNKYGEIFMMPGLFGMPDNLVTFNVDNFEKAFRTEGQWPVRPGSEAMLYYRDQRADGFFKSCMGLLANGEEWGRLRTTANPVLMQHRNAALYLPAMQRVNQKFVNRIRQIRDKQTQEVPGNFLQEINHLTFESVAVVALDRELGIIGNVENSPKAQKLFNSLRHFTQSFYELTMMPSIYKYVRTPVYRRFSRAMDDIFDVTSFYVNEALDRIEKKSADLDGNMSVLEQLATADRKFAIVMAMDMLMGGVDTTSSALSGIMLNLAKNPEKQAKLREEIVSKLPNPTDEFTFSDMKSLPYLRAFIKESLRIHPVVFGNIRATGADMVLNGYQIPKETRLFMNATSLYRDDRFYPRANEFIPERWLRDQSNKNDLAAENTSPFAFLPFGFGPRMCVGKRIVDMEMEITVANLVRNFQVEYNYPTDKAFVMSFVNLAVIPLKFKFTDIKY